MNGDEKERSKYGEKYFFKRVKPKHRKKNEKLCQRNTTFD